MKRPDLTADTASAVTEDDPDVQEQLALDAIKAVHTGGGKQFSNREMIEFLETPRTLFNGLETVRPPKRGPASKKTVYRAHHERFNGFYHRLIRLPRSGGVARKGDTPVPAAVAKIASRSSLSGVPEHKRVAVVRGELQRKGIEFDDKAIRNALSALGLYGGETTPD